MPTLQSSAMKDFDSLSEREMLALAISNRFWIIPALNETWTDRPNGSRAWTARLRNHVLGEQLLGFLVLLVVGVLGFMQPAIGQ